jgi:hypothetical protein
MTEAPFATVRTKAGEQSTAAEMFVCLLNV